MEEIWLDLHRKFTKEELSRIGEIEHIAVPMNDLSASINLPPSGNGYFVMFDEMLDLRLAEIFTAPRNEVAWAACYVRAAWGTQFKAPYWLGPKFEELMNIRDGPIPVSCLGRPRATSSCP